MAVFEVETGGKVFEIEAPDQQSAIAALDSFARRNGANNGIGVSGDEIRAANAGDTRSKMSLKDIEYGYDTAAARGDANERKAMARAYVNRERADSPITTGVGDRVRAAARGVPFVGEYLDEANAKTAQLFGGDYQKRLDYERARDSTFDQANPLQSMAAKLAGGVGGTIAAAPAAAATGTSALLGLGAKSIPGAIGRGALAGGVQGAVGGYGGAEEGQDALTQAAIHGAAGAAVGGAIPIAAGVLKSVAERAFGSRVAMPTTDALKKTGGEGYDAARAMDVKFDARSVALLGDGIEANLLNSGYRDYLAPKTFRALSELKTLKGQSAEIADIDGVRRLLGRAAADPAERDAAREAISSIDGYLMRLKSSDVIAGNAEQAASTLREARGNYAAAKRAEMVESAMDKSANRTQTGGSGSNIDNVTRQQFRQILDNPKKLRGFSPEEVAQIESIVRGGPMANGLRLLGKLAPTGVVSVALSSGAGFQVGGVPGALALPAIGYAAKFAADRMTASKANALLEMVQQRSPMGEALAPLLQAQKAMDAKIANRVGGIAAQSGANATPLAGLLGLLR